MMMVVIWEMLWEMLEFWGSRWVVGEMVVGLWLVTEVEGVSICSVRLLRI